MKLSDPVRELLVWLWQEEPGEQPALDALARALFLDTIGCAIAGLAKPELKAMVASFRELDPGIVPVLGAPADDARGVSLGAAAVLYGAASCWDEACEGLARAHGRPGLHAFAAALPLGLSGGSTYGAALTALVRGFEVGARLGESLRIYPGMHVDGTWGGFAAVTSAASLSKLDVDQALEAIQGMACQIPNSLYLPIPAGATVRNLYVGNAAARAITQALAVRAGINSPAGALDHLERSFISPTQWSRAGQWLLPQGYLKPYAAVRHVHYGAAAGCQWHALHRPAEQIVAVHLEIYEEAITYCGNRAPASAIEAQFSLSFGLAHALICGDLGPDAYFPDRLMSVDVRRVEALIVLVPRSGDGSQRGACLRVEHSDGSVWEHVVGEVIGDPKMPMSSAQTREKFTRYVAPVLGLEAAQTMADRVLEAPLTQTLESVVFGQTSRL
jgi:2-methylcitrate dehydratase PrpD